MGRDIVKAFRLRVVEWRRPFVEFPIVLVGALELFCQLRGVIRFDNPRR